MAKAPVPNTITVAGSSIAALARLRHPESGELLVQADVAAVALTVIRGEDGVPAAPRTVAVADAVFSEPQTWSVDASGYNLAVVVLGGEISEPNSRYEIAVALTLTDGNTVRQLWRVETYSEMGG